MQKNFDEAKENIQPLASGRNASILQAAMESPQELLAQRQELERAIQQYNGDDPLESWYSYIDWIEQSYPSGGKESGLEEVLTKCLSRFESESRYYQDRRMVKLYIKFIDSHKNPTECYQQLFNAGIGTMVAELYICWAYYYDLSGNYRKAEEIFRRGLDCRAQPFEDLQEAHQHFGFTVAQRLLYKDDKDVCQTATQQLHERRMALTSLRGHKHKATVGSIRTGTAIKHVLPGTVKSDLSGTTTRNTRVLVLDENTNPNVGPEDAFISDPPKLQVENHQPELVVRAIIDAARNQENQIEPGPWNKALGHTKNPNKLFGKSLKPNELAFSIHIDDPENIHEKAILGSITDYERNYDKPFKYPVGFKIKNRPQSEYHTPVTIENESNPRAYPEYNKMMLYPRPNVEMQLEELRAYYWFKRRGVENAFTSKRDTVWSNDVDANMRQYPNFAKHSTPQIHKPMDEYYEPEKPKNVRVDFKRLYDTKKQEEFSFEELMLRGLRRYDTICEEADMEETVCMPNERIQRRKSFYPASMRRSMASKAMGSGSCRMSMMASEELKRSNSMGIQKTMEDAVKKPQLDILKKLQTLPVKDEAVDLPINTKCIDVCMSATEHQYEKYTKELLGQSRLGFMKEMADTIEREEEKTLSTAEVMEMPKNDDHQERFHVVSSSMPFEIYEDPTLTKINPLPAKVNVEKSQLLSSKNEAFQFKAPILPKPTTAIGTSSRVPFEIFTDSSSPPQPKTSAVNSVSGGLFDADETCSTQKFNIFLKSQLVSTPKMSQKVAPRQFTGVLKDPSPTTLSPMSPTEIDVGLSTTSRMTVAPAFSPTNHIKQLSTILETSEHGTTQGTTQGSGGGGSAKLVISINSPEYDTGESAASSCISSVGVKKTLKHGEHMQTVEEQSRELSSKLENLMESMHMQEEGSKKSDSGGNGETLNTPNMGRITEDPFMAFSICADTGEQIKKVGQFSRLEVPEDTDNLLPYMVRPARFQEDKTETVPKMLLNMGDTKFQDDKTETISKMILAPASLIPILLEEDDKGTAESTSAKIPIQPPPSLDHGWDDDMDFFCKTPPKLGKSVLSGDKELDATRGAKRFCERTTPKILSGRKAILDEENSQLAKSKLLDSMLPVLDDGDLSVLMGSQPHLSSPTSLVKSSLKTNFSECNPKKIDNDPVMDTQPQGILSFTKNPSFVCSKTIVRQNAMDTNERKIVSENDLSIVMGSQTLLDPCTSGRLLSSSKLFTQQNRMKNSLTPIRVNDDLSVVPVSQATTSRSTNTLKRNTPDSYIDVFGTETIPQPGKDSFIPMQPSRPTNLMKFKAPSNNELRPSYKTIESEQPFFELNAATEMFSTNISMIRNSTLLVKPIEEKESHKEQQDIIGNTSVHTKMEISSPNKQIEDMSFGDFKSPLPPSLHHIKQHVAQSQKSPKHCDLSCKILNNYKEENAPTVQPATRMSNTSQIASGDSAIDKLQSNSENDDEDFGEMSIYYKNTPKSPHLRKHLWVNDFQTPPRSEYVAQEINLNHTFQMIEHLCDDPNVNPFNADLISAFLDQIDFTNYIKELPTCEMVGHVPVLYSSARISVNGVEFISPKLIGEGAYGAVYSAIEPKSGRKYALKQERPPNNWEYYICLEVHTRLQNLHIIPSYMKVEYALVGNNSSIIVSPFYQYGSLISVCNKIKRYTNKNVDEYVVMYLSCELLDIIDNLHAISIIHADIKADNIILMKKLSYPSESNVLHLIDFGVSIDMKLFKNNQTFNYVHNNYAFKCVEMREKRAWSYQLDLCGLAGVIHVLLFGKYMDIEKRPTGVWMPKTRFPRYFNKMLWENIFKQLLNIPNSKTMPNLQELRVQLKEEIAQKEKYLCNKMFEFNMALGS